MHDNRGSADLHVIGHRGDIDGLRAISVLAVVAFHIKHTILPGGFLGVDVFFVISGYLITSIIWREALMRDFSIARFYERRIRRIGPAMLVMLAATMIASLFILLPLDLIELGKSVFSTILFVANIFFWRVTGNYFGGAAGEKPLLHMWSLGVEEQFYIFFPLVVILLARVSRRHACWLVLALGAVSFALNVIAIRFGGAFPAFYLLPMRAWELCAGAFLALLPEREGGMRTDNPLPVIAGWAGLAFVVYGITSKSDATAAIISTVSVVFGSMAILWSGSKASKYRNFSSNKILAYSGLGFFGKISYSLYLWHWPIIVLAKYYLVSDFTILQGVLVLVIMVIAGALSWRYVERPFRSKAMTTRTALFWNGGATIAIAACAASLIAGHGFPSRLNAAAARINASVEAYYHPPISQAMRLG